MSWARAVVIASGFFFVCIMLLGQIPSYIYTVSTLSTLARFEEGLLTLAVLSLGLGLLCLELSLLYDPKPLLPWPLFALAGLGIGAVGTFVVFMVYRGGWHMYAPDGTWPTGQGYLIHPAWFQYHSINIAALGLIALLVGLGMFGFAVLNPYALRGRLAGPLHSLAIRLSLGLSIVLAALYLTLNTFVPQALRVGNAAGVEQPRAAGNIMIFLALALGLLALQLWLLPILIANRQQFMPGVYLHGVVGLIGNIAVPFLLIWALLYPVVNAIHNVDTEQFWVQCAQKTVIPGSCTFTPFTGYLIAALAFGAPFTLIAIGYFFWPTRRNSIVLAGTIGLIWLGLAAMLVHIDLPEQVPIMLLVAVGIVVLAFVYTWATQREFAPTVAQPLGCTGQWLVLGTLLLIYLFGFAFFSIPSFFESEAIGLFYAPGHLGLHDAYWVLALMGGLVLLQLALLTRREPMSNARKFSLWAMLIAVTMMIIASIQGFHKDPLSGAGFDDFEGSHALFLTAIIIAAVGIGAALLNAVRARGFASAWGLGISISVLVGLAFAFVMYTLPQAYPELVVAGFILTMVGAFAYDALGPDPEIEYEYEEGYAPAQ